MHTRRILIVDDAPEFAHLVQDALLTMSIPLETTVFLSGEEAWLEALKTRFDLVITDLRLPGISGTELVRRLRSRYPDIKIIAVSGLAEAGLMERTRAAGVDAFYRKPVEIPLLLTQIDNLLADSELDGSTDIHSGQQIRPSKQDTTPVVAKDKTREISPADLATMHELERRLLQLMQESGAEGIALSSGTGHILVSLASAAEYKPDSNLVEALSMLKNAIKRSGIHQTDTSSIGLLILPGNPNDLIVGSLGKFFFWLLFPSGSHSVESGKAVAAWNESKDNLQYLVKLISLLPTPRHPHPPQKTEERVKVKTRQNTEIEETPKVTTGELTEKHIPKEEVDAFWASTEPGTNIGGVSSDAISFDQASTLGLLPEKES